jgi:SPP1 gp7 family putative phage head morphogenesis protein
MELTLNASVARYDPTHTTALRNAFAKNMKRRFGELSLVVATAIVKQDCFGLTNSTMALHQMTPPHWQAFNFARNTDKLDAFMKWLEDQVNKGILDVRVLQQVGSSVEANWMNIYLFDSYKRGLARARYEMQKLGLNVPNIEESGGWNFVMGLPMHIDRLGLIYTRMFTDLKGITTQMDTIISRILAQGLADGDSMRLIANKILFAINGSGKGDLALKDSIGRNITAEQRALDLARTEIIRAHHLATIQEYRNWGLFNIKVKAEWKTAGDDRVCPQCMELDGQVFTLDQIEYMIPLHNKCRCIALPFFEETNN